MSVNYDLYETPDLTKSGEEQPLHARVVLKGSYTAEEFVEQVTAFQHMPHAQVVGVIEAISKELRHLLLKGFSVELGDIGRFSVAAWGQIEPLGGEKIRARFDLTSDFLKFFSKNFRSVWGELILQGGLPNSNGNPPHLRSRHSKNGSTSPSMRLSFS